MTWVKVDDQFADHPKVVQAGPMAGWLYICGLTYASRYLTDGYIPLGQVPKLAAVKGPLALAKRLVAVGLWEADTDGYRIHDYLRYNPSAESVMAERAITARRAAMNANPDLVRSVRGRDGDHCRYCGRYVTWRDRRSANGGTYDHVTPLSKGGTDLAENIVVCCRECNSRKGARTPDEAGMQLAPPTRNLTGIKTESDLNSDNPSPSPSPSPTSVNQVSNVVAVEVTKRARKPQQRVATAAEAMELLADSDYVNTLIQEAQAAYPRASPTRGEIDFDLAGFPGWVEAHPTHNLKLRFRQWVKRFFERVAKQEGANGRTQAVGVAIGKSAEERKWERWEAYARGDDMRS